MEQRVKKTVTPIKAAVPKKAPVASVLFGRENYKWMLIGLAVAALGFFLLAGGKSSNPAVFNDSDIYSPVKITIAPILIVAGLAIEIFAILRKAK